ncbi:MAG: GNAT family N-acetyltransferase [Chitinophagales bacterium]
MQEDKDFYRKNAWRDAPLFHQPWWLDAAAGEDWDVCVLKERDEMMAYFLYSSKKNFTAYQVIMPKLTQFLGPNYHLTETSVRKRQNGETEILQSLLQQLPSSAYFESRWHFRFQNWLPFYWKGFHQTTRYTYVLSDISSPGVLRESFSEKINRDINKAEKHFSIAESHDTRAFFRLLKKNFQGKKMQIPFEEKLLEKIFNACQKHNAGKIFLALDSAGKIAAGIFVVWDSVTAYYLIGGKDDDFGNSGATTFLFWNAFINLKDTVRSFDFEGSMIKGVENYFRSFGAEQKGYFEISKITSPLLKLKSGIHKAMRTR